MGGLDAVDLGFSDIRMVVKGKNGDKEVLDGSIKGRARPGRMLAIMGPSGAGKDVKVSTA
jgi:ABC-type multidrug transport system ATPase subunit